MQKDGAIPSNRSFSRRVLFRSSAVAFLQAQSLIHAKQNSNEYSRNLTKGDIERWMTELSNWNRWGKDDQAGTINLITPAKRREAALLVKEGASVSLSLDADIPSQVQASAAHNGPQNDAGFSWKHVMDKSSKDIEGSGYAMDTYSVSFHGTQTTHLDALSHLVYNGRIYNGYPATAINTWGATRNSVMAFKNGIFTRGILIDIPWLKGVPFLGDDEAIYPEDLDAWERKAQLKVGSGDAVLIRTGRWKRVGEKGPLDMNKNGPGLYASCAKWLRERDIAILGSDAVQDVRPSRVPGVDQPIHQLLLVAMGTPLLDNCDLEALSEAARERRRWAFLLTTAPLTVPGGTGSPLNPIATF
jgi:kynurenine formamidase